MISTIGKSINALTQEEKDAIAKFRLKYGASKKWCEGQLRRDKRTITRIDEDLASRNQIFKEKIDLLDSYWHEKHKEFVADYARRGR